MRLQCKLCRIQLTGKPVKYGKINFCGEEHRKKWCDEDIRQKARARFACTPFDE